jgi:hypothetical protein
MQSISGAQAQRMLVGKTRRHAELYPRYRHDREIVVAKAGEHRQRVRTVTGLDFSGLRLHRHVSVIACKAVGSMRFRPRSIAVSCATGLPRRMMQTASPAAARVTNSLKCAFASARLTCFTRASWP